VLNQLSTRHEGIWWSGGIAPQFLTSTLDGGEWSASLSGRFTPGDRDPGTYCIGGWMGPRSSLNAMEDTKLLPMPGIEPRSSKPVAHRYAV
jgi:hypothetical protein